METSTIHQCHHQTNCHHFLLSDNPTIVCFVDVTCANVNPKGESTTGCATLLAGSAVVCRSKTRTWTALSSTEAGFCASPSAAKTAQHLLSSSQTHTSPRQHQQSLMRMTNQPRKRLTQLPPLNKRTMCPPHALTSWTGRLTDPSMCLAQQEN